MTTIRFHDENGATEDCNCVYMPYCDGASFSGFRQDTWPVSSNSSDVLYFRGARNLDATLDVLFQQFNFGSVTELIVTGGSAGGLSTFLHSDHIADRVQSLPQKPRVTAAPVVGYFLDHGNEANNSQTYPSWMNYIYHMQNISGSLHPDCIAQYASEPYKCFIAPHMVSFVKTPFFMFNSRFDQWQLDNIEQGM